MEIKRTRRSFSPEFKKQAVQRVLLLKEPAANVASELEIKPETLSKWVRDYEKMVAQDPSYATAPVSKRPVIKLSKKKGPSEESPSAEASGISAVPQTSKDVSEPYAAPVSEEVQSPAPLFTQVETKSEENRTFEAPALSSEDTTSITEESASEPRAQNSFVATSETDELTDETGTGEAAPRAQQNEKGFGLRRQGKSFRNQRPNRNDKNQFKQNSDISQPAVSGAEFTEEHTIVAEPPAPKRPVPKASEGRSWRVAHALDQRPNYREENEEFGYVDEFSIPAEDLDQVWQILSIMQEKADTRAFSEMVHQKGLNVPDEVLENPRVATMQGPNVPNKPWLRKMRMHPAADEFFQTTPDYAKAVYETYEGLDIRLDKNSEGTPILSVEKKLNGSREITIDFSKFDRFVDDFYGDFVRDCKKVMMDLNPKEYPGLNAFIRIPDEPMWNPKLWAGVRTFTWNEGESLSQAWIRYANSLRRNNRQHR